MNYQDWLASSRAAPCCVVFTFDLWMFFLLRNMDLSKEQLLCLTLPVGVIIESYQRCGHQPCAQGSAVLVPGCMVPLNLRLSLLLNRKWFASWGLNTSKGGVLWWFQGFGCCWCDFALGQSCIAMGTTLPRAYLTTARGKQWQTNDCNGGCFLPSLTTYGFPSPSLWFPSCGMAPWAVVHVGVLGCKLLHRLCVTSGCKSWFLRD